MGRSATFGFASIHSHERWRHRPRLHRALGRGAPRARPDCVRGLPPRPRGQPGLTGLLGSHASRAGAAGELCCHPSPCRRGFGCRCRRRRHRALGPSLGGRQCAVGPGSRRGGTVADSGCGCPCDGQAAAVRADFAGGSKDEMTVVDHWAVLVHKLAAAEAGGTGSQGSATPGQARCTRCPAPGQSSNRRPPGSGALAMAVAACSGFDGGVHKVPDRARRVSHGSTSSGSTGSPSSRAPATSAKTHRRLARLATGSVPVGQTVVIEDDRRSDVAGDFVTVSKRTIRVSCGRSRSVAWTGPPLKEWRKRLSPYARALATSAPRDQPARVRLPNGVPSLAKPLEARVPLETEQASRHDTAAEAVSNLALEAALSRMPRGGEPVQRCVSSLGLTPEEAARSLGIAEGTVRKQLASPETTSGTWSRAADALLDRVDSATEARYTGLGSAGLMRNAKVSRTVRLICRRRGRGRPPTFCHFWSR